MAVFLSPGVYVREIDLSLYVPNLSTTALGLVGLATKGPLNEPQYISNPVQFATIFGDPDVDFMGPYAALQYLHSGRQLWYVRVSEFDPDDQTAYAATKASTTTAAVDLEANIIETATVPTVTSATNTSITFTSSSNVLNFIVDGINPGFDITLFTVPSGSLSKSVSECVAALNANSTFASYMIASMSNTGTLTIKSRNAGKDHSLQISGSAYTNGDLFDLSAAGTTSPAYGTGDVTEFPYVLGNNVTFPVTTDATHKKLRFITTNTALANANIDITLAEDTFTLNSLVSALNANSTFNVKLAASSFGNQLRVDFNTAAKALTSPGYTKLAVKEVASGTAASILLTSTGTAPTDGTEVALGTETYVFKTALSVGPAVPFEVLIGATGDASAALTNLKSAVNADAGEGTTYGTGTTENADITATTLAATTLLFVAKVVGTAGNALTATETSASDLDFAGSGTTFAAGTPGTDASSSPSNAAELIFGQTEYKAAIVGAVDLSGGVTINAGVNDKLVLLLTDDTGATPNSTLSLTITPGTYTDLTDLIASMPASTGIDYFAVDTDYLQVAYTGGTFTGLDIVTSHDNATTYSTCYDALFAPLPLVKKIKTSSEEVLSVTATTEGTWGNNLSVAFANVTSTTFDLNVYEKGYLVESYKLLVQTPETIADPSNPTQTIDNPKFVEIAINDVSPRITVVSNGLKLPNATTTTRYKLKGGLNGETPAGSVNPSIYIGVADGVTKTGLQFFRNPEEMDLNLIAVPGISDASVINEMIDICMSRGDAMALIDPPFRDTADNPLTPQTVVDWRNGTGQWASDHATFNSSYAALYWPWLEIYDPVNKATVWTAPSGHVANVYAYSDFTTEPWRAPAGLTRGRIITPRRAEYNPTLGERDLLYTNNVNPIATFIRDGINVFGQKTLQTAPTALDRVNVRRLMLYLEKVIATAARQLTFEPDDEITWLSFVNLVDPFLQAVKDRRGLIEYQVRCDATTNTPDRVDRNEMNAIILLKPTKAAEFIQLDFVLTAQSTSFNELVF